jgi:hypothetical protein
MAVNRACVAAKRFQHALDNVHIRPFRAFANRVACVRRADRQHKRQNGSTYVFGRFSSFLARFLALLFLMHLLSTILFSFKFFVPTLLSPFLEFHCIILNVS